MSENEVSQLFILMGIELWRWKGRDGEATGRADAEEGFLERGVWGRRPSQLWVEDGEGVN